MCPEYSIMQTPPAFPDFPRLDFQFPVLFVFRLKANCQLDDLDWILEPVEPAACNSENNLLPLDPFVVRQPANQQRRASLEKANFIFQHEIQLRGTHSENSTDYWTDCDLDNNSRVVLSWWNCSRGTLVLAKAKWMRERNRIWNLDVNLTLLSPHSSILHLDLLLHEPSLVENSSSRHQLLIELRIWWELQLISKPPSYIRLSRIRIHQHAFHLRFPWI